MNRNEILEQLKENPKVSVLIVGAGINGIGTFRDLALNGLDVLMVDRGDFCSGASAASSHMAHGGIRYLENGEFRLVREAVGERNRLIQNAPHIVQPLPTTIPIFKYFSGLLNAPLKFLGWLDKPSERGSIIIKLGLIMYDAYTGNTRTVPRHQFFSRSESLSRWSRLNPEIVNTAKYYDGLISNPERLALEVMLDGEADNPHAHALNYVSMVKGEKDTIVLRDELTDQTYEVRPQLVINAAGPWIDFVNHSMGLSTRSIGGTKGSHVVIDHPELRAAIGENEFFFENKDGRIVLLFPLQDRVMIGTSDIKIDNPDEAYCTDEEVDYFIGLVARVFPDIKVTREQIVFRFTGVRPLGSSGAKTTGQYSRDHHIEVLNGDWTNLDFPIYSLVGGKWTSFRAFSEQVTDKVLTFFSLPRQKDTRDLPIGGGRGFSTDENEQKRQIEGFAAWTGLEKERLQVLYSRYGSRTEAVATFMKRAEDEPLKTLPSYTRREIMFLAQYEKISRLDDLLLRRTMLAMLGRLTKEIVLETADVLGDALGWSSEQKTAEAERTLRLLRDRHGVQL
ncbi:glycerol-3-phosphate dehydrogenase/oxidase [Candidatus Villigracilis affinis]|uniref:glycerol-3-phosphate dehydrogenase/oxidase n=1 Tax=Candidatus Villigracilis affinis TaxID=3140682 RepID=UPI001D37682C|nr:glycerol-3-phosphate dehydrogenase/oxidase [Anaerolineales bacterium]